jgi:hypothetical protein
MDDPVICAITVIAEDAGLRRQLLFQIKAAVPTLVRQWFVRNGGCRIPAPRANTVAEATGNGDDAMAQIIGSTGAVSRICAGLDPGVVRYRTDAPQGRR